MLYGCLTRSLCLVSLFCRLFFIFVGSSWLGLLLQACPKVSHELQTAYLLMLFKLCIYMYICTCTTYTEPSDKSMTVWGLRAKLFHSRAWRNPKPANASQNHPKPAKATRRRLGLDKTYLGLEKPIWAWRKPIWAWRKVARKKKLKQTRTTKRKTSLGRVQKQTEKTWWKLKKRLGPGRTGHASTKNWKKQFKKT